MFHNCQSGVRITSHNRLVSLIETPQFFFVDPQFEQTIKYSFKPSTTFQFSHKYSSSPIIHLISFFKVNRRKNRTNETFSLCLFHYFLLSLNRFKVTKMVLMLSKNRLVSLLESLTFIEKCTVKSFQWEFSSPLLNSQIPIKNSWRSPLTFHHCMLMLTDYLKNCSHPQNGK